MIVSILPLTRALRAKASKDHAEIVVLAEAIASRETIIAEKQKAGDENGAAFISVQIRERRRHVERLTERKALLLVLAEELDLLFIKFDVHSFELSEGGGDELA